jgi:hypothetical protein
MWAALLLCCAAFAAATLVDSELYALLQLRYTTGVQQWYNSDGWGALTTDQCTWHGVVCSPDRRHVEYVTCRMWRTVLSS